MEDEDEQLFQRIAGRTTMNERRFNAPRVREDVIRDWLLGMTVEQIAAVHALTIRRVNQLLAAERKLIGEGVYADAELKGLAPTTGKPGRPRKPLTEAEVAIRAEYALGTLSIVALAHKHGTYPAKVRYILNKARILSGDTI